MKFKPLNAAFPISPKSTACCYEVYWSYGLTNYNQLPCFNQSILGLFRVLVCSTDTIIYETSSF